MTAILILGVDPGLNRCGWGLVLSEGSRLSHVAHGVIKPPQQQQLASRLHDVFEGLNAVIEQYQPHEAAVEETFVNSNARAALMATPTVCGWALRSCSGMKRSCPFRISGPASSSEVSATWLPLRTRRLTSCSELVTSGGRASCSSQLWRFSR